MSVIKLRLYWNPLTSFGSRAKARALIPTTSVLSGPRGFCEGFTPRSVALLQPDGKLVAGSLAGIISTCALLGFPLSSMQDILG